MINLIKNEFIKLYKRPFIWVSLIIVIITCLTLAVVLFTYNDNKYDMDANWKEQIAAQNKNYEEQLADINLQDSEKGNIELSLNLNKVFLEYNIKPSDWRRGFGKQLATLHIDDTNTVINQTDSFKNMIINDDWKANIESQNKIAEQDLIDYSPTTFQHKDALNNLAISDLRLEYNIKPILSDNDWKNNALIELSMNKTKLLTFEYGWAEEQYQLSDAEVKNLTDRNTILMYKIEHDIPDILMKSFSSYLEKTTVLGILAMIIIIVLSSITVTNEYIYGTITQLLTYPYKRWKILFSKFFVLATTTLGILIIMYLSSLLIGLLFFKANSVPPFLMVQNGKAVELNYFLYITIKYIFIFFEIFIYTSLAILISLLTKNPGISIGITTILAILSKPILSTLSITYKIDNLKFVPFSSFNLNQFIDNKVLVSGITPAFAIIMTSLSFLIISYMYIPLLKIATHRYINLFWRYNC